MHNGQSVKMKSVDGAVIFDLYGTLVDVRIDEIRPSFWEALSSDFFAPEQNVSGRLLKTMFLSLCQKISYQKNEGFILNTVFRELLETFGMHPTPESISLFAQKFRKRSITHLSKQEYTDDLLQSIRSSGYKLGLVSNTEVLLTAYDLKVLGLDNKFDAMLLSSDVGVKKPDKRIFDQVLTILGAYPRDCVFVGDNFNDDVIGALNAGMDAVYLTDSMERMPDLINQYDHRIVRSTFNFREIREALEKIGFPICLE